MSADILASFAEIKVIESGARSHLIGQDSLPSLRTLSKVLGDCPGCVIFLAVDVFMLLGSYIFLVCQRTMQVGRTMALLSMCAGTARRCTGMRRVLRGLMTGISVGLFTTFAAKVEKCLYIRSKTSRLC